MDLRDASTCHPAANCASGASRSSTRDHRIVEAIEADARDLPRTQFG